MRGQAVRRLRPRLRLSKAKEQLRRGEGSLKGLKSLKSAAMPETEKWDGANVKGTNLLYCNLACASCFVQRVYEGETRL